MYDESGLMVPYGFEKYERYPEVMEVIEKLTIPSTLVSCYFGWELGSIIFNDALFGAAGALTLGSLKYAAANKFFNYWNNGGRKEILEKAYLAKDRIKSRL